ncbi:MAG: histidine--tRNA ligase [Clostridia bacterium]|nr:histidine--tRNA ligase [Clostridia bacterium]
MEKLELKNVKGSFDYESKDQIIRNYISNTLEEVFERYGYKPLSTSILCYYDLLTLKYEEDNDIVNEIYKIQDQANRNLALRYDLTVPFAKYIAVNKDITMPYKRYEIGKVFRDGPVKKGRMREFIQCDVDSVGIEGQFVEAELIALAVESYKKLGIDVVIKYNNRKLMTGIIEICGISEEKISQTITIIDKLEKLSKEELEEEFLKIGLEKNQIDSLIDYLNMSLEEIIKVSENKESIFLKEGTKELYELNSYIEALNLSKYVKFSISLARGQEYYTGTVFEAYQVTGEIKSSIGGGGRYDKMIGDFIGDGKTYPAVGISFGLDVIFDILKSNQNNKKTNTTVYIIPMKNNTYAMKVAGYLRDKNINVDIEMNNKKMKKALDYANSEEIPFVIIIGEEELKENKVVLKNMKTGAQMKVKIENIEENLIDINYKVLNPGGNKTAIVIGNEYTAVQKKN